MELKEKTKTIQNVSLSRKKTRVLWSYPCRESHLQMAIEDFATSSFPADIGGAMLDIE